MQLLFSKRLAWSTAAVLIAGLLVCGAVLIWAPEETNAALIGLAGLALGAVLRGLFHGHESAPAPAESEPVRDEIVPPPR